MGINHKDNFTNPYYVPPEAATEEYDIRKKKQLMEAGIAHNRKSEEEKNVIRQKENYILPKLSPDELDYHAPNVSQEKINAAMTNRDAIKEIYGEDAYAAIDATYMASEGIRSIPIHHSLGSRAMDRREPVLELDFAGSGYAQTRKEHRGLGGVAVDEGANDTDLEQALRLQYGSKVTKIGNKNISSNHIRKKSTTRNGMTKERYSFPGPSADNFGLSDTGSYNIATNTSYALEIAISFLTPLMEEYRENPNNISFNTPIHINITGHSRGAIAASETLFEIKEWLSAQPGMEDFANLVHFDLLQRDPVPGPDVIAKRKNNADFRNLTNVNATTIYTTVADKDAFGVAFRPQRVRGQKRIIVGTMPHSAGLEGVDLSQTNVAQDESAHGWGFYDPENHEYYRGSGLAELPDGVYITDEKRNLFRITQYSQIDKLMNLVNPEDGWVANQAPRQIRIRNIVKNWMIDNPEKLIYPSKENRKKCLADAETNKAILMNSSNSWLLPVQNAIRALAIADNEQTKEQASNQLLLEVKNLVENVTFEDVNKAKEVDASRGTKNQKLNALCDLYCTLQTEANFKANGQVFRDKWAQKEAKDQAAIEDKQFNQEKLEGNDPDFVGSNDLRKMFEAFYKGISTKYPLKIPHSDSDEIKDLRAKTKELLRAIDNSHGKGTDDPKVRVCLVKVNAASITYQKHIRRKKGVNENDSKYVYSGSDMGKARYDSAHAMEQYTAKLVRKEIKQLLDLAEKADLIEQQQNQKEPRKQNNVVQNVNNLSI